MKNIEDLEKVFVQNSDKCPFCDFELSEHIKSVRRTAQNEIFEYACNCQIVLSREMNKSQDMKTTGLEVRNQCNNQTYVLHSILNYKIKTNGIINS